ncbi:hypothetical protein, partial [Variovorax sp. MHTC-1]|uniref:hypothetical protein n=1 Tax=Variovorax sp. MHTC-1 TaxID=2495593 RepID=UPI0021AF6652
MPTDQFTWALADAAAKSAPAATELTAAHLAKELKFTETPRTAKTALYEVHNVRPSIEVDVCSVKMVAKRLGRGHR